MGNFSRTVRRNIERRNRRDVPRTRSNEWGDIIVYGARCLWWDSGAKAGRTPKFNGHAFPCCPHCGGLLMQVENEAKWFEGVDDFEKNGHPNYRAMLIWSRGKCFKNLEEMTQAFTKFAATPDVPNEREIGDPHGN